MTQLTRGRFIALLAAAITVVIMPRTAVAQPKPSVGPSSTHIFPAGGQRGTVIDVAVGGECLPPGTQFNLDDASGKVAALVRSLTQRVPDRGEPSPRRYPTENPITYPKQWASRIAIAADAPTGSVFWRLTCAQGGTAARPFVVGDLPEVLESESNSTRTTANEVRLPVTINGQICGERDVDYFRLHAQAGDVISCEVLARRLGSPLDSSVTIVDSSDRELPVEQCYLGSDYVIAAAIPADGDYFLRISNISLQGDPSCVYRLNVSSSPYVFSCFPAGGQRGTQGEITFLAMTGRDSPAAIKREISFPTRADPRFTYQSALFANSITLGLTDCPVSVEAEPNDKQHMSHAPRSFPAIIDGCFQSKRDVDWFSFQAEAGQRICVTCATSPFPSSAIAQVAIFNSAGASLASATNIEPRADCRIEWTAPEAGVYWLRLRDLRYGSHSGPDHIYRLTVRESQPDYALRLSQGCINVVAGETSEVDVVAERLGGFSQPIELQITGLPPGVTCEPATVPRKENSVKLRFRAADDAAVNNSLIHITGHARIAGTDVQRPAHAPHLGVDGEGASWGSATTEQVALTVNRKPAFRLFCSEAYQYAHRGSVFMYPMEVERLNGFEGEITLQIGDRQNRDLDGIEMFEVTIPADQSQTHLPIYLPETMHINIQSQSQLYAQGYASYTDAHGHEQSVLVLSEKRNMLRTLPPVVKLRAPSAEVRMTDPSQIRFRLNLERTENFDGPMHIDLVEPAGDALRVEHAEIPAGATDCELVVSISPGWKSDDDTKFRFQARGRMVDGTMLITETCVKVIR